MKSIPHRYRFATANDSDGRDPVSRRLEGSNDGNSWSIIDQRNLEIITTSRTTYTPSFLLPNIPLAVTTYSPADDGIAAANSNLVLTFNVAAADQGFSADANGDGLANGIEAWFGTNPVVSNAGITPVSQIDTVFTFTHPQANPPLGDVSFSYEWSTNMIDWYPSGTTVGTTTVDIDFEPNTPAPGITEVQADTESSTVAPTKLFIRGVATQN